MLIELTAAGVLLIIAFITDVRNQTIPNWLTGGSFVVALVYHVLSGGLMLQGLLGSLLGGAAGFLPLLILYALGGIGAGDVKLFGALGAWIGASMVVYLMIYSVLYAGVIGIVLLAISRSFVRNVTAAIISAVYSGWGTSESQWFSWAKSGKSFPFMLAVAPAAITIWMIS